MDFDTAFHKLLGHEGGYANHPDDPGGETMWGVTARVARSNGYTGAMRDLPVSFAKDVYRRQYWDAVKADDLPAEIRYQVFDAAVNSGAVQAIKWLQRAVGTKDDGIIGPKTLNAANVIAHDEIVRKMLSERLRFMTDLKSWSAFSRGWARRIADLLEV